MNIALRTGAVVATALLIGAGAAIAKLPPLNEEQKAKAEEAKTKKAEADKKDAEALTKAQDRVAEHYIQAMKAKGVEVKPTPIVPAAPAAPAPAAAPPAEPGPKMTPATPAANSPPRP